jgi:adenylate cyclase
VITAGGPTCASCGKALPDDAKFCSQCGTPVEARAAAAEYKQVTVLFADVVHSMDIAAALGAERLREIMTDLVERCAGVVKRYGGTVDKFTGDGIMAVFGAPAALEDHASRACMAALDIQGEAGRLAVEIAERDGITLQLRVGLNSGEVIAGEIGSGALGYTTIGEQVGMAQRMESVAPSGGVMLSESTARLVEHTAMLGNPEHVQIKGASEPVAARHLLAMRAAGDIVAQTQASLVGRGWEMAAVSGILQRAIEGRGSVVSFVGPAGLGKTRLVQETATLARSLGADVITTYCESHTSDVPFHVVARLSRAGTGVADLVGDDARARVRDAARPYHIPGAVEEDLLMLDDLLGIADPAVELPKIDPDARRRRLTALINSVILTHPRPAVIVIEDAHWIDEVSESMIADFLAVIPRTRTVAVITYRPEYHGVLTRIAGTQTINLAPLTDSDASALVGELMGSHPSLEDVAETITKRAAGNPFFAEEMVRELAQRGVLDGDPGGYVCRSAATDVSVPATLQATIAARIDRLEPAAKRTLSAAAVIGARFTADLIADLDVDPEVEALVTAELVDQVRFTPRAEFAFRHPLIRAVAYESQLKSARAQLHRRLAAAIEANQAQSADEYAALIAEHLDAGGDPRAAYQWHMRAGAWSVSRDVAAAQLSWERACEIADSLPKEEPDRVSMQIAPRTMLCSNILRTGIPTARFEELRELCTDADDKRSLAIGISGLINDHMIHGRVREGADSASEQMALAESIGDTTLIVALTIPAIAVSSETGRVGDVLRWSQRVIDLAGGDALKGDLLVGSPLATALASRGSARFRLGLPGWRDDFDRALALARGTDPLAHAIVAMYKYVPAIPNGMLVADDQALREIEEALQVAEGSTSDLALGLTRLLMSVALAHRDSPRDRERGSALMEQFREMCLQERFYTIHIPVVNLYAARKRAMSGNAGGVVAMLRDAVDKLLEADQLSWVIPGTAFLVEALLARGGDADVAKAATAIERLMAASADEGVVMRDIMVMRLRALLARARGHEVEYRDLRDRYREMANSLGYEGHMAWAAAMP